MTVEIPLSRGFVALVDDEDAPEMLRWRWRASPRVDRTYALRDRPRGFAGRFECYMHRAILLPSHGMHVDHRNLDGLNNQRFNLREATRSQNASNRRTQRDNLLGFKGVQVNGSSFAARIRVDGKLIRLGFFPTPELAHAAYCAAAVEHFDSFARFA